MSPAVHPDLLLPRFLLPCLLLSLGACDVSKHLDDDDDGGSSGDGGIWDGGADGGSGDGGADGGSDGGSGDGGSDGGSGDGGSGDGGSGDGGSGDGGSGDGGSGDGGSGDGGSGDGGSIEFMDVSSMQLSWSDTLIDQAHGRVTVHSKPLSSSFDITLSTDAWTGDLGDTEEYCMLSWATDDADTSTSCTNCWSGMAWSVDSTVAPLTYGDCHRLDPDDWGDDVVDGFTGFDMVYGYGPDQAGHVDVFLDDYGWAEDYGLTTDSLWGAYAASSAFGLSTSSLREGQWGVAYAFAADAEGELEDGGIAFGEVVDDVPPDGWYWALGAYYFPVE